MLEAKHWSNEYWAEAVATGVYILSICPIYILKRCTTKSVKNRVPQEA
jgi:hypothetical protein